MRGALFGAASLGVAVLSADARAELLVVGRG